MLDPSQIVVCVPAKNEAARLPGLLAALATQTVSATVLIAINNSDDDSAEAIASARRRFPDLRVTVDEITFPLSEAHAGSARRRAMDHGAALAGNDGVLITTDADTRPPPDWIASNIVALRNGLDIVGGRIRLDEAEEIAQVVKALVAINDRYWAMVRDIEDSIDPLAWDPPPRHGDHTGASMALTARRYLDAGGVPLLRSGEDRALVREVCARGGLLGHPASVWTRVSARTVGRAEAGMAEAMAKLSCASTSDQPVMLPHFSHWTARAHWRQSIRTRYGSAEVARREPALAPLPCDMAVSHVLFDELSGS